MAYQCDFSYGPPYTGIDLRFPDDVAALRAFFDSQGYMKGWKSGLTIPRELVPSAVVHHQGKRLFDFQGTGGAPIVSLAFKTAIESFESGVHQFFPVTVIDVKTGEKQPEVMFAFNVTTAVDSI